MRNAAVAAMGLIGALALSACTSNPGADLSGMAQSASPGAGGEQTLPPPGESAAGTATAATGDIATSATTPPAAAVSGPARLAFAPVIGAPTDAIGLLSQELAARARARGITVVPAGGSGETYLMKGYFSTIAEGSETTVIYVWDVLDPAGTRLHRIQGQQKADSRTGTGWSAVSATTMQAIADQTIDKFAAWFAAASG